MTRRSAMRRMGPGRDRWLVSYADFITLLFALFVVLFAASNADKEKVRSFAEAIQRAIEHSGVTDRNEDHKSAVPALQEAYSNLRKSLETEVNNQQVAVQLTSRGLIITLNQTAFFRSGAAELDPSMDPALQKIAGALARMENPIRLEGHTDSLPIHNDHFRNNWELSSARSIAVLELLATRFHISPARMAVAGYASTTPVSSNSTQEGRARNRRVDIVVLNDAGLQNEPGEDH